MAVVETMRGLVDLGNLGQEQIDTMMVENPVRYFTPATDGAA